MIKQLSCETSTEATSSGSWDNELPTRHRRDTEITPDMASEHSLPTTEGKQILMHMCSLSVIRAVLCGLIILISV